jgi:hypothetical protein
MYSVSIIKTYRLMAYRKTIFTHGYLSALSGKTQNFFLQ